MRLHSISSEKHIEEIRQAGLELPAVNQVEVKFSSSTSRSSSAKTKLSPSCILSASRSPSWSTVISITLWCRHLLFLYVKGPYSMRRRLDARYQALVLTNCTPFLCFGTLSCCMQADARWGDQMGHWQVRCSEGIDGEEPKVIWVSALWQIRDSSDRAQRHLGAFPPS